jgi:hypothetical protein
MISKYPTSRWPLFLVFIQKKLKLKKLFLEKEREILKKNKRERESRKGEEENKLRTLNTFQYFA